MLKQTKGAITLLIQAYSSVLTNSFTASRKNSGSNHHTARTAAALILSVLMAGTAATAYAETTIKETVEATEDLKDYKGGDLTIEAKEDDEEDEGIHAKKSSIKIDVTAKDGEAGDLIIKGKTHGISSKVQDSEGYVTIKATGDITIEYKDGDGINIDRTNQAEVSITAGGSNTIKALSSKKGDGIKINKGKSGDITLVAEGSGDGAGNIIEAGNNGIDHNGAQTLTLKAEHGINKITARNGDAVRADGGGTVILNAVSNELASEEDGLLVKNSTIKLQASKDNSITSSTMKAIEAKDQATIYLQAKGTNELTASEDAATAIQAEDSQISLSGSSNTISAGTKATFAGSDGHEFGNGLAIKALKDSHVTATASDKNQIFGAVYAEKGGSITLNGTFNGIYSNAVIKNAGGMEDSEDEGAQKVKFHTALYAEGADSSITLSGSANILHTYAERGENNRERAIWAYDGGDITINGYTSIATDDYTADTNSDYISIVAGTSVNLTEEDVLKELPANKIAKVEINYADYSGTEGSGKSVIQGDILAAYAGKVTIQPVEGDTTSGLDIKGNLLSANKGELNVNLGNGGTLTGRIDDYAEAGVVEDGHARIFNPAFSYKVYRGGHVNLTMGPNSIWKVTGQSWVTSIHTPDVSDDNLFGQDGQPYSGATIDLLAFDNNYKQNAHSLTIYDMQGDARFRLHLNGNRNMSDMLYIRHGSGHYLAIIPDMVTLQDMYATYEGGRYEGLRFATVGEGSDVTFTAVTLNGGVNNVVYEIGTDSYATSRENEQYNGATLSLSKPGDDTVDGLFASQPSAISNDLKDDDDTSLKHVTNFKLIGVRGQPVPDVPDDEEEEEDPEQPDVDDTPDHSGSADTPVPDTPESDITESDTPADDQHDYPVNSDDSGSSGSDEPSVTPAPDKTHNDNKGSTGGNSSHNTGTNSSSGNSSNAPDIYIPKISDSGKTIIDMSRANYANAVYMDTLNKRLGEARFYGQNDDGVWARIRYDNIGKENSFRSHNVMVEAGYDVKTLCDHGINLTGFALDYMHGDIDYRTVNGDGDLDRYGLWFHTTYLGNDGQYADLVLKYAHLETDFDFNNRYKDEKITGDYDNDIFSVSGEYGWKFASAEGWYIEPQGQLQYTYVTSADYTTSQDTKVSLDSIHSLIGRAGFRAGRDFLKAEYPCTVYLRADVLHEFAGDQKISAHDKTGPMDVTYKNDDTWYSAGLGLSMQSSENTYFFVEAEQIFGADNESSYTFTGGFSHRF